MPDLKIAFSGAQYSVPITIELVGLYVRSLDNELRIGRQTDCLVKVGLGEWITDLTLTAKLLPAATFQSICYVFIMQRI